MGAACSVQLDVGRSPRGAWYSRLMFTGLVEAVGVVLQSRAIEGGGRRITVTYPGLEEPLALGESVAVDGACLTVVAATPSDQGALGVEGNQIVGSASAEFEAELSPETLHRTTLEHLAPGARVNLERALRVGDRLGGHMVTGHVDGVAEVEDVALQGGEMTEVALVVPAELAGFVAEKGSVTLAGVSLTVNQVTGARLAVQLIPHTRSATTLGDLTRGSRLNVEVDLIARYVQRLLQHERR